MLRSWAIAFIFPCIFSIFILLSQGRFDAIGYSDALFIPGVFTIGIAILRLISRTGTYDVSGYGLSTLTNFFKPDDKRPYRSMNDYREKKLIQRQSRRYNPLPSIVIGLCFIALSFVFSSASIIGS
jgi:hypothetical protein